MARFIECCKGMAELDGTVTPRLLKHLEETVGENPESVAVRVYVTSEGKSDSNQPGIHSDAMIPGLYEMAGAVHGKGGKLMILLSHTGLCDMNSMGDIDITRTVIAFGMAAAKAKAAGCDGVRLDLSSRELLGRFLSPCFNKRQDQYGGSLENRSRFLLEVMGTIRSRTGNSFLVDMEINPGKSTHAGATVDDLREVAHMMENYGVNMAKDRLFRIVTPRILSLKHSERVRLPFCKDSSVADIYRFVPGEGIPARS